MSYDFTVLIPELIGTHEEALSLHNAMCEQPDTSVPDNVQRFIDELNAKYGYQNDDESGFLSVAPLDGDARGAVVPTSIWSTPENRLAMLELTRDHGFGLYDPQVGRLYDPRGHIRITTQLGDGHDVPYLSPGLLAELFDHPHPENPWVIIERRDHHYIQSRFTPGELVEVEHRRGGPDHHYGAVTADRQLAQRVLWGWATGSTDWESALQWTPMDFT
ncbi:hypothetical protein [Mycolicibacterium mageritense]|uniref:Uncharacterized protein n=1 Tax=Mycolicibacterium mageritense TaxID=53462 RepID=A0AAI8TQ93_MYCME|nr:hypothetical protein [Mycolicibacterium mageritense]BDY26723.1 hypothetical protein hbim_00638 [Mycolicibacterium mageritense]